jgi:hypothetical protein
MSKERSAWWLVLLGALAVGYAAGLAALHTLTGAHKADGIGGGLLGLFIASQPAANLFDLLFYGRASGWGSASRNRLLSWLALNLAVLALGAFTIVLGTTQMVMAG